MKIIEKIWGLLSGTQISRFLVSGQIVMLTDIAVYYLLLKALGDRRYIKTNNVSSIVSSAVNFMIQKFWVFGDDRPGVLLTQIAAFSVSTVTFTLGGNLILWILVEIFGLKPMPAKFLKIGILGIVSWFVSSKAIFVGHGP